jgi:glycosyltransferase involved in cell wall biosynthesis
MSDRPARVASSAAAVPGQPRVTLVAYRYAPDQSIGAVRAENWARWLSEEARVTVVSREAAKGSLPVAESVKVARPPSAAVRMIDRLASWRRARRDTDNPRETASGPLSTVSDEPRVPSGVGNSRFPCLHDLWLFPACKAIAGIRPEIVIATQPPYVSLWAAYRHARRRPHAKLWVDFRDLWTGYYGARGLPGFRSVERRLERAILERADVITTVSEGLADHFRGRGYGSKTFVVYNSPSATPRKPSAPRPGRPFTICYTGTVSIGYDASPLFRLIARLAGRGVVTPATLQIVVAGRNPRPLLAQAAAAGVAEFLDLRGQLSRPEATALQDEADLLLLLAWHRPTAPGVLTGKVFDYLLTDRPILLLGDAADSELARLLSSHGRLVDLQDLEQSLADRRPLPRAEPVDYGDIARRQCLDILHRLAGCSRGSALPPVVPC